MRIPIEVQNIIYKYKMDMDFILLEEERKKNKELIIKFSQIYLKMQKFSLGDKIINSKTKRIGSVVNLFSNNRLNYPSIVIEYNDQEGVHWCISDEDICDFIHYKSHRFVPRGDNFFERNDLNYYTCLALLIPMMFLFIINMINFTTFHVFLFNFISFTIIIFILITMYTIKQMNALRTYSNFRFN